MLVDNNITLLLAEFYSRYSKIYRDKMPMISEMLEKIRPLLLGKDPYYVWDYFNLDYYEYGNQICIRILTEIRQAFYELLISERMEEVITEGNADPLRGLQLLRETYAEALVNLREDYLSILSKYEFSFIPEPPEWLAIR